MIKTAVFVEGQTELILVRELLLKTFQYENISLDCFNLFQESNLIHAEYAFPNENADYHYEIINVGNDVSVLSRILRREKYMWNAGFNKIIGLRDMYSKAYKEKAGKSEIDEDINKHFIKATREQIKSPNIYFIFAIMEVEAWILGLNNCFQNMDAVLTCEYISQNLNHKLEEIDPETKFFHPATIIDSIFLLVGKRYNKSKGDINALASLIDKENYIELVKSGKCHSFKEFYEALIPSGLIS